MPRSRSSPPAEAASGTPKAAPAIAVEALGVSYGDRTVLRDVNFAVQRGEIFAVLGQIGCGKSTLFRQLLALERPTRGRVLVFGLDVNRLGGTQLTELRRRLGAAHQGGALLSSLTVLENVMLPLLELAHLKPAAVEALAQHKLRLLGLTDSAHLLPAQLSRGEMKRAAIARAIATDPQILVCDDILSGLDLGAQAAIFKLLRALRRLTGMTVLIFTPWADLALDLAEHLVVLHEGRVVASGTPQAIRRSRVRAVRDLLAGHGHDWATDDEALARHLAERPPTEGLP